MKRRTVTVISFKATQDDLDALAAIEARTRASGRNAFATRADCMRIALAQTLTLLQAGAR
jgi:hypothetical protein